MKTQTAVDPIEELVVRSAGEMAESLSINRLVGQIYALLYVSPEPVSMDSLVEKLRISKGSVSVNIRILEEWNAVKKVIQPGSRKDFYTAEPDFMQIVTNRLQQGLSRRLQYAAEKLREAESLIESTANGKDKKRKEFYRERLKKLTEMRDLLQTVLHFLPEIRSLAQNKFLTAFLKK